MRWYEWLICRTLPMLLLFVCMVSVVWCGVIIRHSRATVETRRELWPTTRTSAHAQWQPLVTVSHTINTNTPTPLSIQSITGTIASCRSTSTHRRSSHIVVDVIWCSRLDSLVSRVTVWTRCLYQHKHVTHNTLCCVEKTRQPKVSPVSSPHADQLSRFLHPQNH